MAKPQQASLFAESDLPDNLMPWEIADQQDRYVAEVVFNLPLATTYHYLVPDPLRDLVRPGCRIEAPFGRGGKLSIGFCVGVGHGVPTGKALKSIAAVLDREPLVDATLLDLTRWIAERYLCGWGQVLSAIIPAGVKSRAGTREVVFYQIAPDARDRIAQLKLPSKQRAVIDILLPRSEPMRVDQLAEAANCGPGPIHALRDRGLIVSEKLRTFLSEAEAVPIEVHQPLQLTVEQKRAVDAVLKDIVTPRHETFLLHGVTGSGKTEVYIRIIEEVVSYGRQAIVLVPEISLTPQTIRRFRSRFSQVAVLHSHLTDAERHAEWRRIASGTVQVVVGARSAIFAPTPHLGVIVIDEEHETSFKQDSTPRYHAREVARRRADLCRAPLILGSATPTLESWMRIEQRQDRLLSLPRRVAQRPMPPVSIVDIRDDPLVQQQQAIGRALRTAMQVALRDNGQIILFLNVRGFSPLVLCRGCGEALRCPDCDLTLTWHKQHAKAMCHTCGYETDLPLQCPKCHKPGFKHLGIGTERLELELKDKFPNVSCLRMDSDTMRARGSHDEALERFRHGEVRILLGTQMIAKGLDFPNVTLVGVIDADTSLRQPDLRARERTFQLIAQVAGRTGRGTKGGRVIVQTTSPEDPAIQFAARHDYLGFAQEELQERRVCRMPPFQVTARGIVRGPDEKIVDADAAAMVAVLREVITQSSMSVRVVGPAPCPLARLHGMYRFHFQLMADELTAIQQVWIAALPNFRVQKDVEYVVDVDPLSYR